MVDIVEVSVGKAKLICEVSGQGTPLLFLHAGVADRRMWQKQAAGFSDRFFTLSYDRRGFGDTTAIDEVFSHVEDLREVMDYFDLSTATLVGCSQGGRIAVDFYFRYPTRVASLILIAPAISGNVLPQKFPKAIQSHLSALDDAEENEDIERINAIEAQLWLDGPTSPEGRVRGALRELFLDMNGIALGMPDLTQEIVPASIYERLNEIHLPTLVLHGSLDFPHVQKLCNHLVETIPNAKGVAIDNTAHLPNLERPEEVTKLIKEFLT